MQRVVCEKQLQLELKKDIKDLTLINFIIFVSMQGVHLYFTSPKWKKIRLGMNLDKPDPYRNDNYFHDSISIIEALYKKENRKFNYEKIESYIYNLKDNNKDNDILQGLYSLGFPRSLSRESLEKVIEEITIFSVEYLLYKQITKDVENPSCIDVKLVNKNDDYTYTKRF